MAVDLTPPVAGTPPWWLLRLLRRLEARAHDMRIWQDYYEGRQPLAFASDKFRDAFGERFPAFSSNFASLVVEGTAERLEVQGFRFGEAPNADDLAWRIWQENDLDANSQLAQVEALIKGTSYLLVEPQATGEVPIITAEDALECIVEHEPRSRRRRRAGLKRWVDDSGQLVVVIYLPEGVYKYRTKERWGQDYQRWQWGEPSLEPGEFTEGDLRLWSAAGFEAYQPPGDDAWPLPNRLEVVPLVELPNRPRLRAGGQSEIAPIRSNQDAVNKYRTDALIASEFAAFPQRYLLNYEPERDAATGRAIEPFRAAIDRLWTVPPPDPEDPNAPKPEFGQFAAASLEPYQGMIELEVGHIASISRLPYHYLLGSPQSVPPSGESLKSSEAGLGHKTGRQQLFFGEGYEEAMRVAFLAMGESSRAGQRLAETIWRDSETRNEAVRTDSIVKLHAEGIIDDEVAWEMHGLSPQQIARLRARREAAGPAPAQPPATRSNGQAGPPQLTPAPAGPRMGAG